jgi:hypothetical protein
MSCTSIEEELSRDVDEAQGKYIIDLFLGDLETRSSQIYESRNYVWMPGRYCSIITYQISQLLYNLHASTSADDMSCNNDIPGMAAACTYPGATPGDLRVRPSRHQGGRHRHLRPLRQVHGVLH